MKRFFDLIFSLVPDGIRTALSPVGARCCAFFGALVPRERRIVALAGASLLVALLVLGVRERIRGSERPWFAPYVNVTAVPAYPFEERGVVPSGNAVLAFVVASEDDPCEPSWGGYYSMDETAETLALDDRIDEFRHRGGRIAVSFGGAKGDELSTVCEDPTSLRLAYRSVIDRYGIRTLDFDLEGENLDDHDAMRRRADALAELQEEYGEGREELFIWLTLPVSPSGIGEKGRLAVRTMLDAGVELAGVNVMTMNYGAGRAEGGNMAETSGRALVAAERDLAESYEGVGIDGEPDDFRDMLGATPMIGRNDTEGDIFTLGDAETLNGLARETGLARLSLWSAERDRPCDDGSGRKNASSSCSGTDEESEAFSEVLGRGYAGRIPE